eukprot:212284-Chlamydomonas_euryale.AAC.5
MAHASHSNPMAHALAAGAPGPHAHHLQHRDAPSLTPRALDTSRPNPMAHALMPCACAGHLQHRDAGRAARGAAG